MAEIGRNSPCPCGSGKKFKRCCGSPGMSRPASERGGARPRPRAAGGGQPEAPERAGSAGDTQEALRLGMRYLTAAGADSAQGMALIENAALAGDGDAAAIAATVAGTFFWRSRDWDAALDFLARAARQRHEPSRSALRALVGGPAGNGVEGDDWDGMRRAIDLDAWLASPAVRTLRDTPRIEVIEKFAPPAVCDWLVAQARGRLSRATIYDNVTGGAVEDERRTNSQFDLNIDSCGVLTFVLRARIGAIAQRHDLAMEVPKVLHYAPGETFAPHFDYLDPKEPAYAAELARRGQRANTFLLYLNDDYAGGETRFPRVEVSHKGAKGDALLFANVDAAGRPDDDTMHVGLPPTSGEKWVFSQWIREFPRE